MTVHRGHTSKSHHVDTPAPATKVVEEKPVLPGSGFTAPRKHAAVHKPEGQAPSTRVRIDAKPRRASSPATAEASRSSA